MKRIFSILVLLLAFHDVHAQLSGSFESYGSWYIDDSKIQLEPTETEDRIRANSYLKLDYRYHHFTAGVQVESYESKALLNYYPKFVGTKPGTFYLSYSNTKNTLDITVGHFYEKFGSGLVFRAWEDKPLGIANSLVGGKIKYKPFKSLELTTLYGKQRNGFSTDLSESTLFGWNADFKISSALKSKSSNYGVGFSYVNKHETGLDVPSDVYLVSSRGFFKRKGFSFDIEYVFKSKEPLVEFETVKPQYLFDGDALLVNLGYAKKGFGINANVRRTENFGLYAERKLTRNSFNQGLLNYIPSITKQFDYSLTNIYVYQSQPNIRFEPDGNKAGEIGGQVDVFYNFKKGSALGGKNGLNIALNSSLWHGLKGRYDADERKYQADFFGFGQKFYNDYSFEIRKNINQKWTAIFTYLQQYYNAKYVEESFGEVNSKTIVWDNLYNFSGSKTLKLELQHQWADASFKNWAAGLVEYNFNSNWSVFNNNLYNYGNSETSKKINYYTLGTSYSKNATRIQLSYGRQRGGLVCIGGVCRFVPESSGLNVNINCAF
ncbi:DUF6029 family protein [Flavobacterium sp.]|uniref:DUF6029 family protein n=1 Tax=Flavobacterium sp. TaxID=239 RepID=UPI002618E517|nr:DUF6029 family protein [Flavobacterium sp.]